MVGDKLHSTDNLRIASFIGSKSQSGTKLCSGLELAQNVILAQVTASDGFAHSRYCAGTGEHDAWNTLFSCLCGDSSSVCGELGLLHGLRQSADGATPVRVSRGRYEKSSSMEEGRRVCSRPRGSVCGRVV